MNDRFHNNSNPTQSARIGFYAVPSDTNEIQSRQLRITEDGVLSVVFAGYEDAPALIDAITLDVVAGETFDWAVRLITEDTTATVLVVY